MNMGKENFELEQYISCKIDAIDVEIKTHENIFWTLV